MLMPLLIRDFCFIIGKNAEGITHFNKVLTVDPNNSLALNLKNSVELNPKGVQ
jgi:hypothetical protein